MKCRGNGDAPSTAHSDRPSVWIVSDSVDHAVGALYCTKGGWLTRRGAGTPVRPPHVWRNVTEVSRTSGSGVRSANGTAWNVAADLPTRIVVDPMSPPPPWPWLVMRPSSS